LAGRKPEGDGIGSQKGPFPSVGGNARRRIGQRHQRQVFSTGPFAEIGGGAVMVAPADRDSGKPRLPGHGNGRLQRPHGHHLPQAVAPVHPEDSPRPRDANIRPGGDPPLADALRIDRQPADPVAVDARQIGTDEGIAHRLRIPCGNLQGSQHGLCKPMQILRPVPLHAHVVTSRSSRHINRAGDISPRAFVAEYIPGKLAPSPILSFPLSLWHRTLPGPTQAKPPVSAFA